MKPSTPPKSGSRVKVNRREFSTALLGAAVFPRDFLSTLAEPAPRPSLLLLAQDPFSGAHVKNFSWWEQKKTRYAK
jgi:hypothetical protein